MSPSAQGMRVSATVRKQWMQNVAPLLPDRNNLECFPHSSKTLFT